MDLKTVGAEQASTASLPSATTPWPDNRDLGADERQQ